MKIIDSLIIKLFFGGIMQRLIRLSLFVAALGILALSEAVAQKPQVQVSGRIAPGEVRIFQNDSTYVINNEYVIGGTLIIEPGTDILFYPNGRLIDSTGGRIIADGDASASYTQNPDGIDPLATPFTSRNPYGYQGYSDLRYFLHDVSQETVNRNTTSDITVHSSKYDHIYNVLLDTANRRVVNMTTPGVVPSGHVRIPFEAALMFKAARLNEDPDLDVNLYLLPWSRYRNKPVNVNEGQIRFIGQPENNFSREWGHIIVLPGARAAFFRNVSFEGFRKDTTVDRLSIYDESMPGADWTKINRDLLDLTNGSGGAITTFSSRTWLLNCEFTNNMARFRGGALQLLQAPGGYPHYMSVNEYYPLDKNPNITNKDGSLSDINEYNPIPLIDRIDEDYSEPLSDYARQYYDDGRLALYLGRMRNLTFDNNYVQIANVVEKRIGPVTVIVDDTDSPAYFPMGYGDGAFGGAIYMSGRVGEEDRQIEVGLGINHSITINGSEVSFPEYDSFVATGNKANNYQSSGSTPGARGGAIYVGRYTSAIIAGQFESNECYAKFLQDSLTGSNSGYFSMGGAVFHENTLGRLQLRGGPAREIYDNETRFIRNKAGAGGAIFVDGNTDPTVSPIVGGSDETLNTRDYGFDIRFEENQAISFGGAIYSKRNACIWGSGGVEAGEMIGYGGKHFVRFTRNSAGYSGGALHLALPNGIPIPPHQRATFLVRTSFRENVVGLDIAERNKPEIRGGGAVYTLHSDLNLVKGTEFIDNTVYNGNGAGICMVNPFSSSRRFFVTDLDNVYYNHQGIPLSYESFNGPFIYDENVVYPPDSRMQTVFKNNEIIVDQEILDSQSGSGATQRGSGTWQTTALLHATDWVDGTRGYAVGYNGTIVKFTNGGSDWEYQSSGTGYRLTTVEFVSGNTGFVGGDRGIILKTSNSGIDWLMKSTSISKKINDITFINTINGFAVADGGYILKTTDAGETWTNMQPEFANLNGVDFVNSTTGFAVGERGMILKTTNAGSTWSVQFVPGLNTHLNEIEFISASTGFIVGNAGILARTDDGGDTWEVINTGTNYDLKAAYFVNQDRGFVVGNFGTLMVTNDGGETWTEVDAGTNYSFYDVFFPAPSFGLIVGDYGLVLMSTDGGTTWSELNPANMSYLDVNRYHQEIMLPENGVGLGGAIYVLDSATINRVGRQDSLFFNRVRIQGNTAYTGAAIYSDNYDLKFVVNRSLITSNTAYSEIGTAQNVIYGPLQFDNGGAIEANEASSDLANAAIYAEIQGPLPSYLYSEAANSIYDNNARFLIRLPDAPNTKGVLAGTTGIGFGGTDTLRGNYWGRTEANVNLLSENDHSNQGVIEETFFVNGGDETESYLKFMFQATQPNEQGPFEFNGGYSYNPVPFENGVDDNTPAAGSIPASLLFAGGVYDIYDKGTDIKTADYSKRRMSPIEDFAVGIPYEIRRYDDDSMPSYGKYVRRWVRDPFCVEETDDQGNPKYGFLVETQDEYRSDEDGLYYHPIGYPLFLEALINYEGLAERSNHDELVLNETVFFVINTITSDFIRVNLSQFDESAPFREIFRTRVEFVPDSTNRTQNTLWRRTAEGLANFGVGENLLRKIEDNPYNEDRAAMGGRRYHAATASVGGAQGSLFSNRPSMPASNNGFVTFYAGERFRALPVNIGDSVRVISRTVLWKEGVVPAFEDGIAFEIVNSTKPPVYTGNVDYLKNHLDTIYRASEYPWKRDQGLLDTIITTYKQNRLWVTEDRTYPVAPGVYSVALGDARGRDSILSVTAMDTNKFHDPRAYMNPDQYAQLDYGWWVPDNAGLYRWLQVDTVKAGDNQYQNPRDNAFGYLIFRGRPTNPYIVPGGETVWVWARNYPPHWRTIDSLKNYVDEFGNVRSVGQDTLDKAIETFGPYFNAPAYDETNARFLQQDTINFGSNYENQYTFQLFVVDSVPRILDEGSPEETIWRTDSEGNNIRPIVEYRPSVIKCGRTEDGRLIANLTNKLRFQMDINTDDELEDEYAENNDTEWDFRYGRTSYGFRNEIINWQDTIIVDTTVTENEDGESIELINQSRPVWLSDEYLSVFDTDDQDDPYALEFTLRGQINVRIDEATARQILRPSVQHAGALNTDTSFTVIINDGHGGMTKATYGVFINVPPEILNQSLPPAKEDFDYNNEQADPDRNLIDSSRMIHVFDPNYGQTHTYELIYTDDSRTELQIDPCFEEAGVVDLTTYKTTPDWLMINSESGLLYGTPGVTDAPKNEMVSVLVTDENGLWVLKQFPLRVDSTNHPPKLFSALEVRCVDADEEYVDTVLAIDYDLLRNPTEVEEITIRVVEPANAGIEVTPSTITGQMAKDTIPVVISATDLTNIQRDPDGRITIKLEINDGEESYEYIYRLKLSDPTNFISTIRVTNSIGAWQDLQWGMAAVNASTGDGTDGLDKGELDPEFCEYEIPPLPHNDVFDSRWTIPLVNGTHRNVYPTRSSSGFLRYRANIQSGGVFGGGAPNFPVTVEWDASEIPDINDNVKNPEGSTYYIIDRSSDGDLFKVNMKTGEANIKTGIAELETNGDAMTLTLLDDNLEGFIIFVDIASATETNFDITTGIVSVNPNPVNGNTTITYALDEADNVRIEVVDMLGNVVKVLVDSNLQAADIYNVNWNGLDASGAELPSGAYMLRMVSGTATSSYPIAIVK